MFFIWFLIGFAISSVIIGFLVYRSSLRDPVGTLQIDKSDPDETYIFLELNKGVPHLEQMRTVKLNVRVRKSQK